MLHGPRVLVTRFLCGFALAYWAACAAIGASPEHAHGIEKDEYTLFNPTPRELWRELSADRPDFTESPYTVDAGAVQVELSFLDYAHNGDEDTWSVAPTNLKVGLTNNADIQFVFEPYVDIDNSAGSESGFGDTQIRLKVNLFGNDSGDTALAVMPFIKIPTADNGIGNDEFEGGLIVPFSTALTERIGLGLMAELDVVFDEDTNDHEFEFITTAVLGFELTDRWGAYVEGIGITPEDGDFRGLLGTGVTYAVNPNTVLDAGVNVGLTGDADDVNVFTGLTVRF